MLISHRGIFGIVTTLVTARFTAVTALHSIFSALFLRETLGRTFFCQSFSKQDFLAKKLNETSTPNCSDMKLRFINPDSG